MRLPGALRAELNATAHALRLGPTRQGDERPWVLFGSAVLLLHGLRERVGDVDVFVTRGLWAALAASGRWDRREPCASDPPFLAREFDGVAAHVFCEWTDRDPEVDGRQCRRAAELLAGWWCTPLQIVRLHKMMALPKLGGDSRAAKHAGDVAAIDLLYAPAWES